MWTIVILSTFIAYCDETVKQLRTRYDLVLCAQVPFKCLTSETYTVYFIKKCNQTIYHLGAVWLNS